MPIFPVVEEDPFIQEGTNLDPVVYWLDVMATPGQESYFGWKTTPIDNNWNDDAVFWHDGLEEWMELIYPEGHPNFGRSINFAFELLTTDTCAGQYPGDVDNNGVIEPADIVYLADFLYNGGPPPPVMANADPNGDCWRMRFSQNATEVCPEISVHRISNDGLPVFRGEYQMDIELGERLWHDVPFAPSGLGKAGLSTSPSTQGSALGFALLPFQGREIGRVFSPNHPVLANQVRP